MYIHTHIMITYAFKYKYVLKIYIHTHIHNDYLRLFSIGVGRYQFFTPDAELSTHHFLKHRLWSPHIGATKPATGDCSFHTSTKPTKNPVLLLYRIIPNLIIVSCMPMHYPFNQNRCTFFYKMYHTQ